MTSSQTDALLFENDQLGHGVHHKDHVAFNFEFSVGCINDGYNEITIYNGGDRDSKSRAFYGAVTKQ